MGIDPIKVRTVSLGTAAGLGESDLTRLDIVGEELKRLKFKVKLPQQQLQQSFPILQIIGVEKAWLLVGNCAQVDGIDKHNWVGGCPPSKEVLFSSLVRHMSE